MSKETGNPASERAFIPRESPKGLTSPEYDLSAAPHIPAPKPDQHISSLPFEIAKLMQERASHTATSGERRSWANLDRPYAIAPNSEVLMEWAIAPIIKRHAEITANNSLYVSEAGYPLPFWLKEALGTEIREFDFDEAIQKGEKLPDSIKTVYLDHPRTYGATRSTVELQQFIQANPDVLFIIDQANVGFDAHAADSEGTVRDLFLCSLLPDSWLIITTSSTSKQIATGAAWMDASKGVKALTPTQQDTLIVGFDQQSLQNAFNVLTYEAAAREYRKRIIQNRHQLASLLPKGALPFGERNVPHLIVDSTMLGYADAKEMVDAFRRGDEKRGILPMAIKTCEPYADPNKHPEILNHVFIAIPVDEKVLNNLYKALGIV